MATTITGSDLTVTVNDNITLNNVSYGGSTSALSTGCNQVVQRIVEVADMAAPEVGQTWTSLFNFSTANDAGVGIKLEFQYARVTNLDDTNYILLQLETVAANNVLMFKLDAGESYNITNNAMVALTAAAPATGYESTSTLSGIRAAADTDPVDVEIMVVLKTA
jgi:hypothetical protein